MQRQLCRQYCVLSAPAGWRAAAVRTLSVGDSFLHVRQHFFDVPVPQPRTGPRRADLTGMKVWPVSLRLLDRLCDESDARLGIDALLRRRGGDSPLRVLELGAGVGLLGIALAARRRDVSVLLTDPGVDVHFEDGASNTLEWLSANVHANALVTGGRATAGRLLWGCEDHIEAIDRLGRFDLILGSDLLYDPDQYVALRATLDALLVDSRSVAILGFTSRIGTEEKFLQLAAERFSVDNVWHPPTEDGASLWASTIITLPTRCGDGDE
jgi:hypothetical protein